MTCRSILILCLVFLTSCQAPEIRDRERCVIVLGNLNISAYCRCHQYKISKDFVGRIGDSYNKKLDYCDRMIGFRPDEWALLNADVKELMEWIKDKEDSQQ